MAGAELEWVESAVRAAFGEALSAWEPVGDAQTMGFSGASILTVRCTYAAGAGDDLPPCVVVKRNRKQEEGLGADAAEGRRLKARRTDFSYGNECAFLRAVAPAVAARGCRVPSAHLVRTDAGAFTLVLEALREEAGWAQHQLVPAGAPTRAALRWLARFHASFAPAAAGGGGAPLPAEGMWDMGTHLLLERRPAAEVRDMPQTLAALAAAFAGAEPYFAEAGWGGELAIRLQAAAGPVAAEIRKAGGGAGSAGGGRFPVFPTMVHGDYKTANMFFRGGDSDTELAVIDWQWTGPGVGATDIIYLCATSLLQSVVEDWEAEVLRPYHAELIAALGGKEDTYPYAALLAEFRIATLDYVRWAVGARLVGATPETLAANAKKADINQGEYARSPARLVWLFRLAQQFLDAAFPVMENTPHPGLAGKKA